MSIPSTLKAMLEEHAGMDPFNPDQKSENPINHQQISAARGRTAK
jgi:hypothetical protein